MSTGSPKLLPFEPAVPFHGHDGSYQRPTGREQECRRDRQRTCSATKMRPIIERSVRASSFVPLRLFRTDPGQEGRNRRTQRWRETGKGNGSRRRFDLEGDFHVPASGRTTTCSCPPGDAGLVIACLVRPHLLPPHSSRLPQPRRNARKPPTTGAGFPRKPFCSFSFADGTLMRPARLRIEDNRGQFYGIQACGVNSHGNHYCPRDYGNGAKAYHRQYLVKDSSSRHDPPAASNLSLVSRHSALTSSFWEPPPRTDSNANASHCYLNPNGSTCTSPCSQFLPAPALFSSQTS